ncbi:MAG: Crp/Fnr family transcriptional regulator [Pyrinomonadaceae bacterium]|nr:Crp/Fnr family transcriptional regulator [Acidobacteriota bacterium]MBP7377863.1 Crp/Fnr family transcriptional regulator [Pyrinomonadaceae bacterium]
MKPLLANISPELAATLYSRGNKRSYSVEQEIFAEGDSAEFLPVVITGAIKMYRSPEPGKEVIIGIFRNGEMFAVPPVFDGGPFPASASAIEDTQLLQIRRVAFQELLKESAEFAYSVIAWTCEMLREKTSIIRNLATASPEHRVGNVLIKLAEAHDPAFFPIRIAVRRQDIAEMASLTTETTIRVIRRFADQGMLRIIHGKVMIDSVMPLRQFLRD